MARERGGLATDSGVEGLQKIGRAMVRMVNARESLRESIAAYSGPEAAKTAMRPVQSGMRETWRRIDDL